MLDTWREMEQQGIRITRSQDVWGSFWHFEHPDGWIERRYDAGWTAMHDGKDIPWVQRIAEAEDKQRRYELERRADREKRSWWRSIIEWFWFDLLGSPADHERRR